MGLKRMLWRSTYIGRIVDTVNNIKEEGNIKDGLVRTTKEDVYEDNPFTSSIFRAGHSEGKKDGYEEASFQYESKLLDLADKMINQAKICKDEIKEYEQLLDEYEEEIERLNAKNNRTTEENNYLQQLLLRERSLRQVIKC